MKEPNKILKTMNALRMANYYCQVAEVGLSEYSSDRVKVHQMIKDLELMHDRQKRDLLMAVESSCIVQVEDPNEHE